MYQFKNQNKTIIIIIIPSKQASRQVHSSHTLSRHLLSLHILATASLESSRLIILP